MSASKFLSPPEGSSTGFEATLSAASAGQGASAWREVVFNTKTAQSSPWFNTSTGRFTPQVAGFYLFAVTLEADSAMAFNANVMWFAGILKNGSIYKSGVMELPGNALAPSSLATAVVYMNGTTDHASAAFWHNDSVAHGCKSASTSHFSGALLN